MIRILVVENENIIAMEISWIVEDAGYSIVGPERSVETTRQVLSRHKVDLALLDVHLAGETVFPVSEMLDAIGVPYIFLASHPVSLASWAVRGPAVIDQALQTKGSSSAYSTDSR